MTVILKTSCFEQKYNVKWMNEWMIECNIRNILHFQDATMWAGKKEKR